MKLHQALEREAPIEYAIYRTSYYMMKHAATFAGAAVLLWFGWRLARRRSVSAQAAAPVALAGRSTLDGISRLLLQSYAGLITLYHAWLYSWGWVRGTRSEAEDYLDLALTAVALAGILGFAYRRRLVGADLWKAIAVVFPAWNFVYQFHLEGGSLALVGSWLPIHVMLLPGYVSLFLYGYRSEALWEKPPVGGVPVGSPHRT